MSAYKRGGAFGAAFTLTLLLSTSLSAQTLQVNVPIGSGGSPTARGTYEATQDLKKIPGGAAVVPAKDFQDGYALSMKDMLQTTPGVLVQPRWGEESRLSIRGSGLSRGFHLRGITLLQDGIPFNFADGSSDFQEIDPLTLQHVEVYRGGQGLRYGAATLGGAVNMVTPTARTVPYNVLLRGEAGSFGTARMHAQAAKVLDGADMFAATTRAISNGYRYQSEQDNVRFSGNAGVELAQDAETRFYAAYSNIEQEVPGTISKFDALHNPKRVAPVNVSGDYARDLRSLRLANRTVVELDNGMEAEGGIYANDKSLYHPIFQVIDQESRDIGVFTRLAGNYDLGGLNNDFTLGLNAGRGVNDAKRFVNNAGRRGEIRADGTQVARNLELYGENRLSFYPDWHLITGVQGTIAGRDYSDHINSNNDDEKIFRALNPKVGLLWNVAPGSEIYTSVTRSSEVPTFSELVQGAGAGFIPVKLQKAWTAEIGTRGTSGRFSWDATAYHARVKDELLNFTVTPDIPASTFNAPKTIHQGLELGAGFQATKEISFNAIYNFNDFSFDGDSQFGDNDLAGAAPHYFRFAARYEKGGAFIEPNVEYVPEAPFVDYANTLKADAYTTLGVKAGWDVTENVSLFLDARNLTDEKTITSFSTLSNAQTAANTAVFYPADGRSVFGGIKITF